jgi:hypothetical protein
MSLLKGTYTSPKGTVLDYEVVSVNDRFFLALTMVLVALLNKYSLQGEGSFLV